MPDEKCVRLSAQHCWAKQAEVEANSVSSNKPAGSITCSVITKGPKPGR